MKGVNNIRYTKEFRRYVKYEEKRQVSLERCRNGNIPILSWIWHHTFKRIGDDWICLALLGIFMALLSVGVDKGIEWCWDARTWLYQLTTSPFLSYICWIALPTVLVLFAVTFVKLLAPQSVGSGIPEVKTILRGFPIDNHLTFKTLIAKVIGLTATLGSGLPLGKEAPFVHIACIVARLLNKMSSSIKGVYKDDTQNTEMLVAGCAVGISACFASPIGGVLYSIEATSTYFAVRNYWRAFFAAVCSAVVFRLHAVWSEQTDTITALFPTNFPKEFPFDPQELFIFATIGAICGLLGSFWVWLFRQYSVFIKTNKIITKIIQSSFLLYPTIMVVVMSSITCPNGFYNIAGHLSTHEQMVDLFSNFTWSQPNLTDRESTIVANWKTETTDQTNVVQNLVLYIIYTFLFSIIASTIAVPSGTFIPVLKIGACLGRLIGESIHLWFPVGVYFNERLSPVIPGGYAVVGAVAFAGATTHTISVAVMALEMTGQISLIAPIMIALLVSNAIAVHLSPSIYDTIISLKKLPYMPELSPSQRETPNIIVKNFMVKDVIYIWRGMNFSTLQTILMQNEALHHFPLVDSHESMILLGSVQRKELIGMIVTQISHKKRLQVAAREQMELQATPSSEILEFNERNTSRRPSRLEVVADNVPKLNEVDINEIFLPYKRRSKENIGHAAPQTFSNELQEKSNIRSFSKGRFRSTFSAIFRSDKESTKLLDDPNSTSISPMSVRRMPYEQVIDMSPKDQQVWEIDQLNEVIHFDQADIDPAPFQLVEKTPIFRVHGLFTRLGLRRAYVTQLGKLVGVVGLKELRSSIEEANSGDMMIESSDILLFPVVDSQRLSKNSPLLNDSNVEIGGLLTSSGRSTEQSE